MASMAGFGALVKIERKRVTQSSQSANDNVLPNDLGRHSQEVTKLRMKVIEEKEHEQPFLS